MLQARSYLAVDVPVSNRLTCRPGRSSWAAGVFCSVSITCKKGCLLSDRSGLRISTNCSNGRSAWLSAARSRSRVACTCSAKVAPEPQLERKTRVLTKKPIRPSSRGSPRPATGVPIQTSLPAPRRPSKTLRAEWSTVKGVAPSTEHSSVICWCTLAGT